MDTSIHPFDGDVSGDEKIAGAFSDEESGEDDLFALYE